MNRHELREKAMTAVYQYIVMERNIRDLVEDSFECEYEQADEYFRDVVVTAIENMERYSSYINQVLKKGWSYERLGSIEKAILLNGCAEFDLKQISAAVIIDESVEIAKTYCDEEAYKLINSVLDVI